MYGWELRGSVEIELDPQARLHRYGEISIRVHHWRIADNRIFPRLRLGDDLLDEEVGNHGIEVERRDSVDPAPRVVRSHGHEVHLRQRGHFPSLGQAA